jgi:hypothetical protein
MSMKHTLSRKLAVAAATISVVALSGAGLASASASTGTTAASGAEHFYLMTTQPSASKYTIIASGVFTTYGTDTSGNSTDTARVQGGSFKIHHGGNIRILKQSVNPRTCLAQFVAEGSFTLGNGTGAYKKLSGSGKAVITDLGIAPRTKKGTCNLNANPVVNEETITATAHVSL